jgi:hypothetical protein
MASLLRALPSAPTTHSAPLWQSYLVKLGGGRKFTGKMEKGVENKYSCCVLAGFRSMSERAASLKVGWHVQ